MRRVVVTGIGVVSPLGNSITALWNNVSTGLSGVTQLTSEDIDVLDQLEVKIGGTVSLEKSYMEMLTYAKNKQNAMALYASKAALEDAK